MGKGYVHRAEDLVRLAEMSRSPDPLGRYVIDREAVGGST